MAVVNLQRLVCSSMHSQVQLPIILLNGFSMTTLPLNFLRKEEIELENELKLETDQEQRQLRGHLEVLLLRSQAHIITKNLIVYESE